MGDASGLRAAHLRHMAAHLRSLASLEPLESLRRHLRRLAAQHDEAAATLELAIHPAADGTGQAMGSAADSCGPKQIGLRLSEPDRLINHISKARGRSSAV